MSLTYYSGQPDGPIWTADPTGGPITVSHTYGGEDFDARMLANIVGWDTPLFDPAKAIQWIPATSWVGPGCVLRRQILQSMKVREVLPAVEFNQTSQGVVVDLGKNFAGWPAIKVRRVERSIGN